jgi:DNA modification methylase
MPRVREFKLSELIPAAYNPRTISDEALAGLGASLERFGCVEPIVVNVRGGKNVIVGGHQRYKVLQKMLRPGQKIVCVTVDLAKAEEKLLNISLNNPAIQGRFIEDIAGHIEKLRGELGDDAALVALRIRELAGELGGEEKQGLMPDDDVPKPPKKAVTKPGDLWTLGRHRLLCGDSTSEKDVARLMGRHKAALFATDPPYCVRYTGADRPTSKNKSRGKDWSKLFHDLDVSQARMLFKSFYSVGLKYTKHGTALYMWHASKNRALIEDVCDELGLLIHQQIVWVKPFAVFTYSFYCWRHEPCLLMWVKGKKPPYNPKLKALGTVWPVGFIKTGDPTTPEYYADVWELDWDGRKRRPGIEHPTVKPVEVFAIPMRVHTKPGDICYEPFCGSGSQIIAAEKLGRRCFALELEPVFCDVAVKRWEQWTGKKAKRAN